MPPSIFPRGTTIYEPEKCWNGYTLFQASLLEAGGAGAILINMNDHVVNQWRGLDSFPNKMLPGGPVIGSTSCRNRGQGPQDTPDLVEVDWEERMENVG